jgi:hypothetical protein
MMNKQLSRRAAGALALALALVTIAASRRYGPADDSPMAPPAGARCDEPLAGPPHASARAPAQPPSQPPSPPSAQPAISAQIRYDSGLVLRYCGVQAMFAQLGAQEQPGLVRAVYVRAGDGGWIDARRARYLRVGQVAHAYARSLATDANLVSYAQMLRPSN